MHTGTQHKGTQHITFSDSARKTVWHALKETDESTVISLPDDLGIGPIGSYDTEKRIDFFSGMCPEGEFAKYADEMRTLSDTFRKSAYVPYEKKVVWFSRRSVMEYAGFLEFLSLQDDMSRIEVVDLTDGINGDDGGMYGGKPYRIVTDAVGSMSPDMICAARSTSRRLRDDETAYYCAVWARLREENANLRTLWRGQLYSVEEDFYDNFILGIVPEEWISAAEVVGETLGQLSDEYHQTGDLYIYSRLRHLADTGKVSCRGDNTSMRSLEVKQNIR